MQYMVKLIPEFKLAEVLGGQLVSFLMPAYYWLVALPTGC